MIKFRSPRAPWLGLYIFINFIAGMMMLSTGELIGDVRGGAVYDFYVLIYSVFMVSGAYFLILSPLFNFLSRVRVGCLFGKEIEGGANDAVGVVLLLSQLLYLAFNYVYGVNVAGANDVRGGGALSIFWALFPVDALFLIFYGTARDSKYFKINAAVYLVSNMARGWSGVLLFFIFMEWCRLCRDGKINLFKIILATLVVLMAYPFIVGLKFYMRAGSGDFSSQGFGESLYGFSGGASYSELVYIGVLHVVERIQTVSMLVEVVRLKDVLSNAFYQEEFIPFWREGLHGIIIDRIFGSDRGVNLAVAFTAFADFGWSFDVGSWNTNVSYPAWAFISPYLIPAYFLYTVAICALSMVAMKLISKKDSAMDMLWISWLFFVLPPWFGTFVQFVYAALVFLFLKFVFSKSFCLR